MAVNTQDLVDFYHAQKDKQGDYIKGAFKTVLTDALVSDVRNVLDASIEGIAEASVLEGGELKDAVINEFCSKVREAIIQALKDDVACSRHGLSVTDALMPVGMTLQKQRSALVKWLDARSEALQDTLVSGDPAATLVATPIPTLGNEVMLDLGGDSDEVALLNAELSVEPENNGGVKAVVFAPAARDRDDSENEVIIIEDENDPLLIDMPPVSEPASEDEPLEPISWTVPELEATEVAPELQPVEPEDQPTIQINSGEHALVETVESLGKDPHPFLRQLRERHVHVPIRYTHDSEQGIEVVALSGINGNTEHVMNVPLKVIEELDDEILEDVPTLIRAMMKIEMYQDYGPALFDDSTVDASSLDDEQDRKRFQKVFCRLRDLMVELLVRIKFARDEKYKEVIAREMGTVFREMFVVTDDILRDDLTHEAIMHMFMVKAAQLEEEKFNPQYTYGALISDWMRKLHQSQTTQITRKQTSSTFRLNKQYHYHGALGELLKTWKLTVPQIPTDREAAVEWVSHLIGFCLEKLRAKFTVSLETDHDGKHVWKIKAPQSARV